MVSADPQASVAVASWWGQIVPNALFSPVFFGLKNLRAAEVVAWALFTAASLAAFTAWQVDLEAGGLMTVYTVWTLFAAGLATSVRRKNPA
ncbi:MAG: tryptophan-rich sensory protein [Pseudomonadota bacterium]